MGYIKSGAPKNCYDPFKLHELDLLQPGHSLGFSPEHGSDVAPEDLKGSGGLVFAAWSDDLFSATSAGLAGGSEVSAPSKELSHSLN